MEPGTILFHRVDFFYIDFNCTEICKFVKKCNQLFHSPVGVVLKTHFLIEYYCNFYTLLKENNKTKNDIRTMYFKKKEKKNGNK